MFYSQTGKLFAINLLFTKKQDKVDNIDNFVYYGKTRLSYSCEHKKDSDSYILHLFAFVNTYHSPYSVLGFKCH